MVFSRAEAAGWAICIIGVCVMGFMAFHGPFHLVKPTAAQASVYPPIHVKIGDNPKTIGDYQPSKIMAHVGQTVIFTNVSSVDHTATARSDVFNSGNIARNASYAFAPTRTGTFHVYCLYHPLMKAVLVVQP